MSDLMEYKCLLCGGGLEFDTATQKLKCPYCDSIFDMEEMKQRDASLDGEATPVEGKLEGSWDVSGAGDEWSESEADGLTGYSCKSCGAEIVGDGNTAATSCPYCGNPVVMMERLTGMKKPNFVVPFKYDKKAAKESLIKHYQNRKLLPKVFKDENHIDEIKGIYVPFWLFHCDVDGDVVYHAENVRHWEDSEYEYTEVSKYTVTREGSLHFDNIPMDGSEKMPDDMMESIEPFDWNEMTEFQTAYLAGFLADKYDVEADSVLNRVWERVKTSTESTFENTVTGYNSVRVLRSDVNISKSNVDYAMLPVWLLSTKWKDQNFLFAMNGQTGKFVGDLPVDKGLFWKWFAMLGGGFSAIAFVIAWFVLDKML